MDKIFIIFLFICVAQASGSANPSALDTISIYFNLNKSKYIPSGTSDAGEHFKKNNDYALYLQIGDAGKHLKKNDDYELYGQFGDAGEHFKKNNDYALYSQIGHPVAHAVPEFAPVIAGHPIAHAVPQFAPVITGHPIAHAVPEFAPVITGLPNVHAMPGVAPVITGHPNAHAVPQFEPVITGLPNAHPLPGFAPVITGHPNAHAVNQFAPVITGLPNAHAMPGFAPVIAGHPPAHAVPKFAPVITGHPAAHAVPEFAPVITGYPNAHALPKFAPVITGHPNAYAVPEFAPVITGYPNTYAVPQFAPVITGLYNVINVELLSADMARALVHAMSLVQTSPDWDLVTSIHGQPVRPECGYQYCCIHDGLGGFLPYHRLLVNALNQALLKHNLNFGMPYWDWTSSDIPVLAQTEQIIDSITGQIIDNPLFSGLMAFTLIKTTRLVQKEPVLENLILVLRALQEDDFRLFSEQLQAVHTSVHGRVGGSMADVGTSSYDPIFYMHHAFIDLVWAVYQYLKPHSVLPYYSLIQEMVPFGLSIAHSWDYKTSFGYTYNLDINSDRIVFGGMTLAQIQSKISTSGFILLQEGGAIPQDAIYAGFFLQSYQTSGKIKFNCCNKNDCSYPCGHVDIFGGPKEKSYTDIDPTKYDVTDVVNEAKIPLENLRFQVTMFEDLKGKILQKDVYQPISIVRPAYLDNDEYHICFNKNYNLPPKIRIPKNYTYQIDSPYDEIMQTENEDNFENCNTNGVLTMPDRMKLNMRPGNYYYFDKDCSDQSLQETLRSNSYSGSKIHIIKE